MNIAADNSTDEQQLLEMIFGAMQGKALALMAELGIADSLHNNPLKLQALAAQCGIELHAMKAYMELLKQLGLVHKSEDKHYSCTPLGALLRRQGDTSLHHYARLSNSDVVLEMIRHMRSSLEAGSSVFSKIYQTDFYHLLQGQPHEAAVFNGAMEEISARDIPAVLAHYSFENCSSVIDVGGGEGHLLATLLDRNSSLQGQLLELPELATRARMTLQRHVDSGRCRIIEASFLEHVPDGGEIYLLKRVLSHCSDEDATKLLKNLRAAMHGGNRLLLIDPETDSLYGASYNLLMLVVVGGGGIRSEGELAELFKQTGFQLQRKTPLKTDLCIIEAVCV